MKFLIEAMMPLSKKRDKGTENATTGVMSGAEFKLANIQ